ncbi:MAG: glycosyltransferase family 2 protein [Bacteroidota bacterium]
MPPKVSIITITYNAESLLPGTMESVFEQSYTNIEYVIVDGASTDDTVALIRANAEKISQWISEPDKGLYDAMNKGLELAKGDFVLFLNAGDHLHETETIEKVFANADKNTDILFGEVMLVDADRNEIGSRSDLSTQKLPDNLVWTSLRYGMVVSHQAFIVRRGIAPRYISDNLCADIDWVIKSLKKSTQTVNTQLIISDYLIGGVSKQRHRQSMKDRYHVLKSHFGFIPNLFNHAWIVLRALLSRNRY